VIRVCRDVSGVMWKKKSRLGFRVVLYVAELFSVRVLYSGSETSESEEEI
jgi:hypothetical protein